MSNRRQKKSGNKDKTLTIIVFITAILNLIKAVYDIVEKLLE